MLDPEHIVSGCPACKNCRELLPGKKCNPSAGRLVQSVKSEELIVPDLRSWSVHHHQAHL